MNADLDALATALYVTIDDLLRDHPEWAPQRPPIGFTPKLSQPIACQSGDGLPVKG